MNKQNITDHDINNPIEPRPFDSFWHIHELDGEFYNRGNYATIAEAREHKATSKFGRMDMGYSAILDGLWAVRAALYCVGVSLDELGCEIVVNGGRRFADISLSEVSDALDSLIKPYTPRN